MASDVYASPTVVVTIVPEWQGNYGYDFDEELVIIGNEYRDEKRFYQVLGRVGSCWIEAEQLQLTALVSIHKRASEPILTLEQEDALMELAYANPPEMTAEEYAIELMVATVESAVVSAGELFVCIEELEFEPRIKDKGTLRELRRALSAFLAEYDPEPEERGEP